MKKKSSQNSIKKQEISKETKDISKENKDIIGSIDLELVHSVKNLYFQIWQQYFLNYDEIHKNTPEKISLLDDIYLSMIYTLGKPTFSELAESLHLTLPAITIMVRKMIERGYVKKIQNKKDHRVFNLELTEKALQFYEQESQESLRIARILQSNFSQEEQKIIFQFFRKLAED